MTYKNREICAHVKTYDRWSLDNEGEPDDWLDDLDGFEIFAYEVIGEYEVFNSVESAKAHVDGLAK